MTTMDMKSAIACSNRWQPALRHNLRESDTVARVGGDRFIALLTTPVIRRMHWPWRRNSPGAGQPFEIDRRRAIEVTANIIARFADHGTGDIELLRHADDAM